VRAVDAAAAALPAWRALGPIKRAEFVRRVERIVGEREAEFAHAISREQGKLYKEALGEVRRGMAILDFTAGEGRRLNGSTTPAEEPRTVAMTFRQPIGVVGLITPWNFPIAIPAWKIAPALANGCCVVMKPADLVPGCAWALAEIISRSGIAPGVFNLVMGRGSVIGDALVNHPGIHAISFTGSVGVGRNIAVQCATNHKKVQLEMGGKNPQVVLDDADLNQAVELSVQSAFYSTGQRCTASSRLIVTEGIYPKFIDAMKQRMAKIKVGDALAAGTDVGPVSSRSQLDQDLEYVQIGKNEGATLAAGGERLKLATDGFYMSPALFSESVGSMRINKEEIFGPVASVIKVKNYEEALATANDTEFGLSAGIATTSLKYATHFKRHSQAGMVMVNLPTAGVDYHVPFGGRKGSSYGPREQGSYAREFYTAVKTAYVSPGAV
jgi:aldehyde dehydrogenase (NAD+)